MGATAAVVGLRRAVDRKPVVGQTDDYLVARVRAGDDAAFEVIYDRYARGLAFCVDMLGSREEAEDALQLTFMSAYPALLGGESNISLRPCCTPSLAIAACPSSVPAEMASMWTESRRRPFFEGLADQVHRREELREMLEDMQRPAAG